MGGGKGGTSTNVNNTSGSSTVSIPPQVLQQYQYVNQLADQAAQAPFQPYTGQFVAPVNDTQQGGINAITGAAGSWSPYFNTASSTLGTGLGLAGTSLGAGQNYGTNLGLASLGYTNAAGTNAAPYNTTAAGLFNTALGTGAGYNSGATGLALAGTNAVNPTALNSDAIAQYLSPYQSQVVGSTVAQLENQFGQQRQGLTGNQILSGSFGSDRGGVGQDVLSNQQGLALGQTVGNLENQNYAQALAAAQQQQGIGLSAAQANRAALQQGAGQIAGIGQQSFAQGNTTGTSLLGAGNQIYNQGLGLAGQYLNTGNTLFGQGNTAAGTYGSLGTAGAQGYEGIGTGNLSNALTQGQAQLGAGTVQQQTSQALDTALYNQFLQQQGYPFQVAQFLAGIAEGTGALSGSTTTSTGNTSGYGYAPQPFFSDERLKENIEILGHTPHGLAIAKFNYKGSPTTHVGLIAQDVAKKKPEAVGKDQGFLTVDYAKALARAYGGRAHMDDGGTPVMSDILAAHQAMYPGAIDPRGINNGTGPRGTQLQPPTARQMIQGPPVPTPKPMETQREQPTGLQSALSTASNAVNDFKNIKSGVQGIGALASDIAVGEPGGNGVAPTSGLIGSGGKWSNPGWVDQQLSSTPLPSQPGAGNTSTSSSSITTQPLPPPAGTVADATTATGTTQPSYRRGGRVGLATGGLPYGDQGYVPDDQNQNPVALLADQRAMQTGATAPSGLAPAASAAGASSPGALGTLSQGVGLAAGLNSLGAFGGAAAGAGTAAAAGGMSFGDAMAAGLLFADGGRVHMDEGGSLKLPVPVPDDPPPAPTSSPETTATGLAPIAASPETAGTAPLAPTAASVTPAAPPAATTPPAPAPAPPTASAAPPNAAPSQAPVKRDMDYILSRSAPAIAAIESGSRGYDAVSPPNRNGTIDYGKYQVNGPNVPSWTQRWYGQSLTPEQFLKNPQAQEAVYRGQFGDYVNRFGTPQRAALAWHVGEAGLNASANSQLTPEAAWYGKRFTALFNGDKDPGAFPGGGGGPGSQGAGGNAFAFNQPGSGTYQVPPQLDPSGRDIMTGKKPRTGNEGFFDENGWLDRNQREISTGLAFLGNMMASPSHQLAGAVGAGLAAAAPMWMNTGFRQQELGQHQTQIGQHEQGLQQEQQRINIANRTQYMSIWTQLLGRRANYINTGQAVPPELDQQIANVERMLSQDMGSGPATPGGVGSPGPSSTPGVSSTPLAPPAGTTSPPPAPNATGQTVATPPAGNGTVPAPTTGGTIAKDKDGLPIVNTTDPGFLAQLDPNFNPQVLIQRAKDLAGTDNGRGLSDTNMQRARQIAADMLEKGYGVGPGNTQIPVPGWGERQEALRRAPVNAQFATENAKAVDARQMMQTNLKHIANILETYETGNFAAAKGELQGWADAAGLKIGDTSQMSAANFQTFLKNAYSAIVQQGATAGDHNTNQLREMIDRTIPNPEFRPEANRALLGQMLGNIDYQNQQAHDWTSAYSQNKYLDTNLWKDNWVKNNPLEKFQDAETKNVAVRGGTPDFAHVVPGQAYIIEPGEEAKYNIKAGTLKRPTKLRAALDPDGRIRWQTVK